MVTCVAAEMYYDILHCLEFPKCKGLHAQGYCITVVLVRDWHLPGCISCPSSIHSTPLPLPMERPLNCIDAMGVAKHTL